ncbi:odorant receptor Or2-like [Galleria mellonella]|uniref:Odorant receptor n=1 Tax=Galleria mellonella TaxID=7137 RepID=A0A6J1WNQ3_GALME|nr:odorant receptor Or2-like [Galleria mellonella]
MRVKPVFGTGLIVMENTNSKIKAFESFNNTFKYCTYGMVFSNIYPNKTNMKRRLYLYIFIVFCTSPCLISYAYSCRFYIMQQDMFNLTRHLAVGIVIGLYLFKVLYCILNTNKFESILNTVSCDMIDVNEFDDGAKKLYGLFLKKAKLGELIWALLPIILGLQFPVYAGIVMIHENIWKDYPQREMVHEMEITFAKDVKYDSPVFEIIFVISTASCIILIPNFCGLDGSFCIATTHLGFKLKYVGYLVREAFEDCNDSFELHVKMKHATKCHQKALQFYKELQDFYGPWLLGIFIVTSSLIAFNLYQMYIIQRLHPKYVLFAVAAILHMYVPCVYASNVTEFGEDLATELYCAAWERKFDISATKSVIIMLANAQRPLILTGCGIVTYNMQLFITVMKSTYSFYTLITST